MINEYTNNMHSLLSQITEINKKYFYIKNNFKDEIDELQESLGMSINIMQMFEQQHTMIKELETLINTLHDELSFRKKILQHKDKVHKELHNTIITRLIDKVCKQDNEINLLKQQLRTTTPSSQPDNPIIKPPTHLSTINKEEHKDKPKLTQTKYITNIIDTPYDEGILSNNSIYNKTLATFDNHHHHRTSKHYNNNRSKSCLFELSFVVDRKYLRNRSSVGTTWHKGNDIVKYVDKKRNVSKNAKLNKELIGKSYEVVRHYKLKKKQDDFNKTIKKN